jgi:hypothetical protein
MLRSQRQRTLRRVRNAQNGPRRHAFTIAVARNDTRPAASRGGHAACRLAATQRMSSKPFGHPLMVRCLRARSGRQDMDDIPTTAMM